MPSVFNLENFKFRTENGEPYDGYGGDIKAIGFDNSSNSIYFWNYWRIWKTDLVSGTTSLVAGNGKEGIFMEGRSSESQIGAVYGIAVKDGDVYFTDWTNNCIGRVHNGFVTKYIKEYRWYRPMGIVYNAIRKAIAVCNTDNQEIVEIDSNDNVSKIAGGDRIGYSDGIGSAALFHYPSFICLDSKSQKYYVTDYGNHRIRELSHESQGWKVSTFAGNGRDGFQDGSRLQSEWKSLSSIAFYPPEESILARDYAENRYKMREISRSGNVTTFINDCNSNFCICNEYLVWFQYRLCWFRLYEPPVVKEVPAESKSKEAEEPSQENDLYHWLREMKLERITKDINQIGATSLDEVKDFLELDDFQNLSLNKVERRKFETQFSKLKGREQPGQKSEESNTPKQEKHEPSPKVEKLNPETNNRMADDQDIMNTRYQGALELPPDFKPNKSCAEEARELGIKHIEKILRICEQFLDSAVGNDKFLTKDEQMALALYTCDLGTYSLREENFYYKFNTILRMRSSVELRKWIGYMYYLKSALDKVRDEKIEVYRGIDISPSQLAENYTLGQKIHWSSFSSSTNNLRVAQSFASKSGVIFKIQILNGKDIRRWSVVKGEDEILLNPNMSLCVVREMYQVDGRKYVDLVQMKNQDTYVF